MSKHILRQGEPMSKLTPKQEMFAEEFLIDLNATQAAIRAGYSKRTARSQGQRLLTNVDIAEAIQKAMAERGKRTEVEADYVLTSIMETMERCKQAVPVKYQNGDPVMVETPGGDMVPAYKFDSAAVLKGAELLGRHLALFTDKAVVDVNHGIQDMDDSELAARTKQLADRLGIILPPKLLKPAKHEGADG